MTFKPGASPNPGGRPRSEASRRALREAIEKGLPKIIEKLQALAEAGDVNAASLLLQRALPAFKSVAPEITLDGFKPDMSHSEFARLLLAAIAGGTVAPDIAAAVVTSLSSAVRVDEMDMLEKRLRALEGKDDFA